MASVQVHTRDPQCTCIFLIYQQYCSGSCFFVSRYFITSKRMCYRYIHLYLSNKYNNAPLRQLENLSSTTLAMPDLPRHVFRKVLSPSRASRYTKPSHGQSLTPKVDKDFLFRLLFKKRIEYLLLTLTHQPLGNVASRFIAILNLTQLEIKLWNVSLIKRILT